MIDDPDLRLMFTAECEERLQRLEQDLLKLEQQPDLQECLEEVAREIHSLKGAARMLNVKNMEQFAHQFEAVFKTALNENNLSSGVIDNLYAGVDVLAQLANEAVKEGESAVDLEEAIAKLHGKPEVVFSQSKQSVISEVNQYSIQTAASEVVSATDYLSTPEAVEKVSEQNLSATADSKGSDTLTTLSGGNDQYKIDTIRVPTQTLDKLLTHAGELAVSKNRIEQRLGDVDTLIALWEQWKNQQDNKKKEKYFKELESSLQTLRNHIYEDNTRFDYLSNEIETKIRSIRLLPLATVFNLFPRMVRDIAKQEQKQINFIISGEDTVADKHIIEEIKDPLTHLIRNAIHHAIEPAEQRKLLNKSAQGTIHLRAYQTVANIVIEVEDDGHGIDCEKIKRHALQRKLYRQDEIAEMSESQVQTLIFEHGFSTAEFITDISGRGVGMPIVKANIDALKGRIEIESKLHQGTLMRLRLPMTLTTTQVLIVLLQKRFYALPLDAIDTICKVTREQIFSIDGKDTILHHEKAISVAHLADLLGMDNKSQQQEWMCVIVLAEHQRLAILVDSLINEQEVMLKPIAGLLKNTNNISGLTILGDGSVCIILNHHDLVKNAYQQNSFIADNDLATEKKSAGLILYAEDSVTTRTQVKRILEKEGFEVVTAVDGLDAYEKLATAQFDGIVSDVDMPNMNGLDLTEKIRLDSGYQDVPIVLVSAKDKPEDKRRGLEVGATAYISKGSFNQTVLIETLKRLI